MWKGMRYNNKITLTYPIAGDVSRGSRALLVAFEVLADPVALELARRLAWIFAATE